MGSLLDPFVVQIGDDTAVDLNTIFASAMFVRVDPPRQRAPHNIIQTIVLSTVERVVRHDALVVELNAASLDLLAVEIGTPDIVAHI